VRVDGRGSLGACSRPPRPVAVPDRVVEGLADLGPFPVVTVDSVPAPRGEPTELLVMATNPYAEALTDVCLGIALPAGVRVTSATPPSGTQVVSERVGGREVVRCRLGRLDPDDCVGLAVSVTLPRRRPTHVVTAFVSVDGSPEVSLTCRHELRADSSPTGTLHLVHSA
jgi:hypothetical protein